jgi:GT2 family glycosyltransferase
MTNPGRDVSEPDVIPVELHPLDGVDRLETAGGACRVSGRRPRLELVLPGAAFPSGWVLLRGALRGRGDRYAAFVLVERRGGDVVRFELPVTRRGTVNELLHLPANVVRLILECRQGEDWFEVGPFSLRTVGFSERLRRMYARLFAVYTRQPRRRRKSVGLHVRTALLRPEAAYRLAGRFHAHAPAMEYGRWIALHDNLDQADRDAIVGTGAGLSVRFVLVQADPECLDGQLYPGQPGPDWPPDPTAWYLWPGPGARLSPHALYWLARVASDRPDVALIYADHDHLDATGSRCRPEFKPDWSVELLRATNYIGRALALRGDVLAACGPAHGPRNVHDLLLRAAECLDPGRIVHVPAPLFHFPDQPTPAGDPEVVRAHLARCGQAGAVESIGCGCYRVHYALPAEPPLVSVLVATRDRAPILRRCLESLCDRTRYPRLEVVVVDNQSRDPETLAYLAELAARPGVRVVPYDAPFNFAAINNQAAEAASGQALCLLNNDTEILAPDWLDEMVGRLSQPGVGVVGAKLLYEDGRVQHAGDVVGPCGCAWHLHAHLAADAPGYCRRALLAQDLSAVTGACLLTWRHLYRDLGGFDARNLPVSFNDVDYCLRVREAGQRVVFTPHAVLYHLESASRGPDDTPEKRARSKREADYMRRRWKKVMRHDPFYNPNLSYARADFSLNCAPQVAKPWRR